MSTDLERAQQPAPNRDFLRVFNRLCVALREPQDDSGTTAKVYFDVLGDLSIEALVGAANVLAREPGRKFFPTTAEWRTVAVNLQRKQLEQAVQPPVDRRAWQVECDACEDTGWHIFQCDGTNQGLCGRRFQLNHYPHDYAEVCPCRETNRTYLRNHPLKREAEA